MELGEPRLQGVWFQNQRDETIPRWEYALQMRAEAIPSNQVDGYPTWDMCGEKRCWLRAI